MSNSRRMRWDDGEGIDMNDVAIGLDQLRALILGQLSTNLAGFGGSWAPGADGKFRTSTPTGIPAIGCHQELDGAARTVHVHGGVLFNTALSGSPEAAPDVSQVLMGITDQSFIDATGSTVEDVGPASANASGSDRWDIVQVDVVETDDEPEARHFEDATTGAKSTINPNKRRSWSLVFSIKEGTGGAAGEVGKGPAPDSGKQKLCAMKLLNGGAAYTEVHDFRIPLAPYKRVRVIPKNEFISTTWIAGNQGRISRTGAGSAYVFFGNCEGGGNARLMDVALSYLLDAGTTVKVGRYSFASGTFTSLKDITSSLTLDGADHISRVDLSTLAIWMNGFNDGANQETAGNADDDVCLGMLCIEVTSAANNNDIHTLSGCVVGP